MTDTALAEFVLARITDRETVARKATGGPWVYDQWHTDPEQLRRARAGFPHPRGQECVTAAAGTVGVAVTGPTGDPQSMADAAYIAASNPSRELARCESDRWIVRRCRAVLDAGTGDPRLARAVLSALARPDAGHPDFRDEWL